jgi:hypothetical protein
MAFNGTALNAYVKRTYDPKFIENSMTSVEEKILRVIKKETDGSGTPYQWLVDADDAFNGSADFPTAQTASTSNNDTVGSQFSTDWFDYSAVATLTSSIIGKTRNNDGAWQKAVDNAMFKRMRAIAHANAIFLQGAGWGEISQISGVSGSTFTPLVRSDIFKYVKGMPLHFSSTKNTAVLRSTTVVYVTGVVYTAGSEAVTLSATLASVSAANNDWAFIAGCRQNSATPSRLVYAGLSGFCPNQITGTDLPDTTVSQLYNGNGTADRSTNSRLYGTFTDATGGGSALSALIDGAQEAITIGNARKLEIFVSKGTYTGIVKDLQNAVRYDNNPTVKSVGTNRLLIYSDGDAEAHVQVSRTTNDNQAWGFDPSQLCLKSIGGAPHIDSEDGLTMARQASAQGYEIRWFQQAILEARNLPGMLRVQFV